MERSEIKQRLRQIIERELPRGLSNDASTEDDVELMALGVDSVTALEIMYEVEEEFKIKLADDEIIDARTVGRVVDLVAKKLAATTD